MQVVGIRRGVRSTRPEVPERSLIAQRPRSVAVVASVGKVEGTTLNLGRASTTTRNTIGSSDEGNVVVFGGEGLPLPLPCNAADGEAVATGSIS